MVKQKFKFTKIGVMFIVFSIILSSFAHVFANESYEYEYIGVSEYGQKDGEANTAVMELKSNGGNVYKVYCIDKSVYTKDNQLYAISNLEDGSYYNSVSANKIRNIVLNSYPFKSLDEIKTVSNIKFLTKEEAIAGTQAAIWHYSNNSNKTELNGRSKALYDWYLMLPERIFQSQKVSNIEIKQESYAVNDKYEVLVMYKANGKNVDGSKIDLSYEFSKNIEREYGAVVTKLEDNSEGYSVVKISNLNKDSNFKVNVKGTQTLARNAYFYTPESGKEASQSLVGVRDDKTGILGTAEINLSNSGYGLTINKIDSLDLTGIPNVEFQIASDSEFKNNVINATTGENGKVTIAGLTKGMWYIKETKAASGYIPNKEITQVYINETDITLDIKNSKYGKAEVVKIDDSNNPVEGAKFSLYKDSVTEENLLSSNLISNSEGKIYIEELLPGDYILIETETPDDYVLNNEMIKFKVEPYKTTQITHTNPIKGYGIIKILKRDAVTNEQLAGTVIGIYSDSEFKNLITQIETKNNDPIVLDNLRPGTYYLKELKAPDGYLLDSAPKKVTIEKDQTIEVTFFNSKNYSTAGNYATMLIIGASILITGLGALMIKKNIINRRKNAKENF